MTSESSSANEEEKSNFVFFCKYVIIQLKKFSLKLLNMEEKKS